MTQYVLAIQTEEDGTYTFYGPSEHRNFMPYLALLNHCGWFDKKYNPEIHTNLKPLPKPLTLRNLRDRLNTLNEEQLDKPVLFGLQGDEYTYTLSQSSDYVHSDTLLLVEWFNDGKCHGFE